ncbi:MAG: carbamate kinase, partial [candidate division Zixibacteria bacterium]|nr:carbamate kinase [candidate division Zixibacteria bacterium]
ILTSVDKVMLNFGKDNEKAIDSMTVAEAEQYLADGQFPPGSMGPKVKAAIQFVKNGGKELIITSIENAGKALRGESGTRITPN